MLCASSLSLVVPALTEGIERWGRIPGASVIGFAFLVGASFVWLADKVVPHEHFFKGQEGDAALPPETIKRAWLVIFALALHNIPEGLAVGASFGREINAESWPILWGISLQNIPEGLVVAICLLGIGYSVKKMIGLVTLTGIVESLGGFIGLIGVQLAEQVRPYALGCAAGAMIYVVSHEVIPESHRKGHELAGTWGTILGFVLMMILNQL